MEKNILYFWKIRIYMKMNYKSTNTKVFKGWNQLLYLHSHVTNKEDCRYHQKNHQNFNHISKFPLNQRFNLFSWNVFICYFCYFLAYLAYILSLFIFLYCIMTIKEHYFNLMHTCIKLKVCVDLSISTH